MSVPTSFTLKPEDFQVTETTYFKHLSLIFGSLASLVHLPGVHVITIPVHTATVPTRRVGNKVSSSYIVHKLYHVVVALNFLKQRCCVNTGAAWV